MSYSDVQLNAASDIAYDSLKDDYDTYQKEYDGKVPILKLLESDSKTDGDYQARVETLVQLGVTKEEIANWRVIDVYDSNDTNGFYVITIETSPGNAIVAFRGSEGFDPASADTDWIGGDLELLNNTTTAQHEALKDFVKTRRTMLNKYKISATGHSLGGNLAEFFTVYSARVGLDDNIEQCVSLDGPGFSEDFFAEYGEEVNKMKDKMTHYSWSAVGELLLPIPAKKRMFVDVKEGSSCRYDKKTKSVICESEGYNSLTRHDRKHAKFDKETGMFIEGEQDKLSLLMSKVSKAIEHLPRPIGDTILAGVETLVICAAWVMDAAVDKDGNLTPTGIAMIVAVICVMNPVFVIPEVLFSVGALLLTMAAFCLEMLFYELLFEGIPILVDIICDVAKTIFQWGVDVFNAVKDTVLNIIDGISQWYKENFDSGYKYAMNHPRIVIDTRAMAAFADRLKTIKDRLARVDSRIDGLRWRCGPLLLGGVGGLDQEIRMLNNCCIYLWKTAGDFENAEKDIAGKL